jgi:hypothetical protein
MAGFVESGIWKIDARENQDERHQYEEKNYQGDADSFHWQLSAGPKREYTRSNSALDAVFPKLSRDVRP